MTLKEAQRILDDFIGSIVKSFGFKGRKDKRYERFENKAVALLSLPCHISSQGVALFTIGIGLRFDSLAEWIDEDSEEKSPTIGVPIHFLREDKTYTEWKFSNTDDLEKLHGVILKDIEQYALPYIERFSDLSKLRSVLESPNKQDWLGAGLNVDSRVTVLAAIQFVQGERNSAIETLDDGLRSLEKTLAGRTHELRKRRFKMECLRERFLKERGDVK